MGPGRIARRRLATALGGAAALICMAGPAASADAHIGTYVREVYPAPPASPSSGFIEMQSYLPGQTFLKDLIIRTYYGLGQTHTYMIPSNVAHSESQRTLLIGGTGVPGADYTDAGLSTTTLPASGGAVCFPEALPPYPDCVSWGSFSGNIQTDTHKSATGTPAPAIPAGKSLTRKITRGCSTALDDYDDTNNSVADFALTSPTPRANRVKPTELDCASCHGHKATIVGSDYKDTLVGTPGRDVVVARGAADTIRGLGGNDIICAGFGKDKLFGGAGRDKLYGDGGFDICNGGKGKDTGVSCGVERKL